ncbi:peptide deformylase [Rhodobium orientis]|uniref:Peptide deformylase n=1 Tax=Rhodobium orientis TaxID=34017 RepID=A0A327JXA0_9HYPH|nr:peptide deformylase [Rhodobium orientis]MBB4304663.1 peptide deformylase [Rhodobium orientis]MBK5950038.1 peptide deformylase [Rhodobium orientis]RAI27728.1 peptide deformylase [Rhodobium orientis]
MAKLDIITLPDPRLRLVCEPVKEVDDTIRQLMDDMLETMYDAPGIGLAAIQVAVPKRVIVVDVAGKDEEENPICLANPEILWKSEETKVYQEGCLSIPDYYEDVERPDRIRVRFLGYDNTWQEIEADGVLAVCIQHEIDHLDGGLFIDYLSKLKRDRVVKKFKKYARQDVKFEKVGAA